MFLSSRFNFSLSISPTACVSCMRISWFAHILSAHWPKSPDIQRICRIVRMLSIISSSFFWRSISMWKTCITLRLCARRHWLIAAMNRRYRLRMIVRRATPPMRIAASLRISTSFSATWNTLREGRGGKGAGVCEKRRAASRRFIPPRERRRVGPRSNPPRAAG